MPESSTFLERVSSNTQFQRIGAIPMTDTIDYQQSHSVEYPFKYIDDDLRYKWFRQEIRDMGLIVRVSLNRQTRLPEIEILASPDADVEDLKTQVIAFIEKANGFIDTHAPAVFLAATSHEPSLSV